jgi:hypothetical protein
MAEQIAVLLDDEPALSWDQAVAQIIDDLTDLEPSPPAPPPPPPTGRFGFRRGN